MGIFDFRRVTICVFSLVSGCAGTPRVVEPLAALSPRAPAFEWVVLGNLGGDSDSGLTSFLLGPPGQPPSLLIDGGSLMGGLISWQQRKGLLGASPTPTQQALAAQRALSTVRAVLLTHAHLDHWGGLIQASTLLLGLVQQGHPSFELVSLPATQQAVLGLFRSPAWADFTSIPRDRPTFVPVALVPGAREEVGGYELRTVLLHHTIDSAAFVIEQRDATFLHLGDTGASSEVWEVVRPLLEAHRLRAIAIEVSFAATQEHLAAQTGHLTRNSLLLELNTLARARQEVPPAEAMTDAQALELARALAPSFKDCPILAIHIKALAWAQVTRELEALRAEGLNVVLPEVGHTYAF